MLKTGRPLGLTDDATFAGFKKILREEKANRPPDTCFAIRGSLVAGNSFDGKARVHTNEFFDVGRKSDHDIAIVSRTLFERPLEEATRALVTDADTGRRRRTNRAAPGSKRRWPCSRAVRSTQAVGA